VAPALQNGDSPVTVREVMVGEKWYQQTIHYVNEIERVRVYSTEITARRLAEEALRRTADELARSNEELEQFAYVASHDLQEPLRVVTGYVQIDRSQVQGPPRRRRRRVYPLHRRRRFADAAIDQRPAELFPHRHARRAVPPDQRAGRGRSRVGHSGPMIEDSGAAVTCDSLPVVHGDETQLIQLFQNLIGNGIKFRGDGAPQIHVSARGNGDGWEFTVRDNGIGIDKQYWEQIFVIFRRLHTRQQYAGTGIGLAICNRIVERHGGRIWLDSEPGQGTTFHFTLM